MGRMKHTVFASTWDRLLQCCRSMMKAAKIHVYPTGRPNRPHSQWRPCWFVDWSQAVSGVARWSEIWILDVKCSRHVYRDEDVNLRSSRGIPGPIWRLDPIFCDQLRTCLFGSCNLDVISNSKFSRYHTRCTFLWPDRQLAACRLDWTPEPWLGPTIALSIGGMTFFECSKPWGHSPKNPKRSNLFFHL